MKKVELSPGIDSSILGFGCAPILGAVGARVAERAMATALDSGVNHFDIARSYGYGEAEKFVGRFLKGRRDEIVLASKFGIRATWKAGLLRPLKPAIRALKAKRGGHAAKPSIPPSVQAPGRDHFHERIEITPANMRSSLEKSLRALKTDYLDVFFVHEPPGEIEKIDDLAGMAHKLKKEGKIRSWGLAFDWSARELLETTFPKFDLLQFNCSPGAKHYEQAQRERGAVSNVLFSPLRHSNADQAGEVLRQLWAEFPSSVVLCSMFNPGHILENAAAANAS